MTKRTKEMPAGNSEAYLAKKHSLRHIVTIYGRLPTLEALQRNEVAPAKLHLSDNNKPSDQLRTITELARQKGAEIVYHDKKTLSRISKNGKQDQGVALDIRPKGFSEFDAKKKAHNIEMLAVENITNPQNLGMIIRSVCASTMKGLILPRRGCAKIDALVIKASAGTLFKAAIYQCDNLLKSLKEAQAQGWDIIGMDANAKNTLSGLTQEKDYSSIYVLGNESEGLSNEVRNLCTHKVKIPMQNDVESLNVAVAASLIALRHQL